MAGVCSMHGRDEKCIQNVGWKTYHSEEQGEHGKITQEPILRETRWEGADWMHLAEDRAQW
jgi:hypothetical protein